MSFIDVLRGSRQSLDASLDRFANRREGALNRIHDSIGRFGDIGEAKKQRAHQTALQEDQQAFLDTQADKDVDRESDLIGTRTDAEIRVAEREKALQESLDDAAWDRDTGSVEFNGRTFSWESPGQRAVVERMLTDYGALIRQQDSIWNTPDNSAYNFYKQAEADIEGRLWRYVDETGTWERRNISAEDLIAQFQRDIAVDNRFDEETRAKMVAAYAPWARIVEDSPPSDPLDASDQETTNIYGGDTTIQNPPVEDAPFTIDSIKRFLAGLGIENSDEMADYLSTPSHSPGEPSLAPLMTGGLSGYAERLTEELNERAAERRDQTVDQFAEGLESGGGVESGRERNVFDALSYYFSSGLVPRNLELVAKTWLEGMAEEGESPDLAIIEEWVRQLEGEHGRPGESRGF